MLEIQWLIKGLPILGIGCWLLLAALNNLIDAGTNVTLLNRMMSMRDLREDKKLGQGLLYRTVGSTAYVPLMLKVIAITQLLIASTLILSGFILISLVFKIGMFSQNEALLISSCAVLIFMAFWFFFLIGGLWFGYWIKMGNLQSVHFMMLVISMLLQLILFIPMQTLYF